MCKRLLNLINLSSILLFSLNGRGAVFSEVFRAVFSLPSPYFLRLSGPLFDLLESVSAAVTSSNFMKNELTRLSKSSKAVQVNVSKILETPHPFVDVVL